MKKVVIILGVLVGVLSASFVHAGTLSITYSGDGTDPNGDIATSTTGFGAYFPWNNAATTTYSGQSFISPFSGTGILTSTVWMGTNNDTSQNYTFWLAGPFYSPQYSDCSVRSSDIASSSVTIAAHAPSHFTTLERTLNFGSVSLQAGAEYHICVYGEMIDNNKYSGLWGTDWMVSTSSGRYWPADGWSSQQARPTYDPQMKMNITHTALSSYTYSGAPNVTGSFDFRAPTSSSIVPDFENWVFQANNLQYDADYTLRVSYIRASTTIRYYDKKSLGTGNAEIVVDSFKKYKDLEDGEWTVTGNLCSDARCSNGHILDSETITFTVQSGVTCPFSTYDCGLMGEVDAHVIPNLSDACDVFATSSWVTKAGCEVIAWSFIPDRNIAGALGENIKNFSAVFPFSLVSQILNYQSSTSAQGWGAESSSIAVVMPNVDSGHSVRFELLNNQMLANAVGNTVKVWFYNLVLFCLLGGFLWAVIKTIQ